MVIKLGSVIYHAREEGFNEEKVHLNSQLATGLISEQQRRLYSHVALNNKQLSSIIILQLMSSLVHLETAK